MDVSTAIMVWVVVTLMIYFLSRSYGIRVWSSIVLAVFIGMLTMFLVYVPESPNDLFEENGLNAVYALIVVVTYLLLIFYILEKGVSDIEPRNNLRMLR